MVSGFTAPMLDVLPFRGYERFQPLEDRRQFVLLDRTCGIDVLGTDPRTLPNKRAAPNPVRMCQHGYAFPRALIAGIHVIALCQRQCCRADEYGIQPKYRTCRITQRAIDAHTELFVALQLCRSLQKLALGQGRLAGVNQPWLYFLQLTQEIT